MLHQFPGDVSYLFRTVLQTNKRWGSLLHLDVLGRAGLTMKKPLTATAAADSITRAMSLVHHHRHHHHHAMSVSAEESG